MKFTFKKGVAIAGLSLSLGLVAASTFTNTSAFTETVEAAEAKVKNGWVKSGNKTYYYKNGKKVTGCVTINNVRYLFGTDGAMKTNVFYKNPQSGNVFYFGANGKIYKGWLIKDGFKYCFNGACRMYKNITVTANGKIFTFDKYGHLTKTVDVPQWKSGTASAYGGVTDPGCGSITANGSRVTEKSMGVAIPLSWGRRDLLGHKVKITYGNKTVTAVINDLGGMGGGSRHLDLQPGVFRAFGYNSCNSWGLRTVKYQIL